MLHTSTIVSCKRSHVAHSHLLPLQPYHDVNPLQLAIAERARAETGKETDEGWGGFKVGQAILVHEDPVSLIAAPTMQHPGALPKGTLNVYLATRAAFTAWRAARDLPRAGMVPFAVDWGAVPHEVSAAQTRQAFIDAWSM